MTQSRAIWNCSFSDCMVNLLIKLSGPVVFFFSLWEEFIYTWFKFFKALFRFCISSWAKFCSRCTFLFCFPGGITGKEPISQRRRCKNAGSIPRLGRSPGGGHGNPLQYYCLENPRDRGAWRATVHTFPKSRTRLKWQHTHTLF